MAQMVDESLKKNESVEKNLAGLVTEIERLARSGNFGKADKLRDKLIEAHPMALTEIIATADIIEEEKASNIDHNHLAIWDRLYSELSPDEKSCLFYSSREVTIPANKIFISQGKLNPRLFFIDSGRVTLFYQKGENKILLGQLSRGDVVGEDAFFEISHSTLSVACQTEVKLRYLEKSVAGGWDEKHPGLLQKLGDYCLRNGKMREMLLQKKFEKRLHPRKKVTGRIVAHILTGEGRRSGAYFRGGLQDLSRVGMCFDMRCSKTDTAQALLARNLELILELSEQDVSESVILRGQVVKVNFHMHNDYSVHVRLAETMANEDFRRCVGLLRG